MTAVDQFNSAKRRLARQEWQQRAHVMISQIVVLKTGEGGGGGDVGEKKKEEEEEEKKKKKELCNECRTEKS
jgi:hypothetical protein